MEFSVSREAIVFLYSALAGCIIGMVRDVFCVIRKQCGGRGLFTDLTDIVFWISAAVIMFAVIFFVNNGKIRWYEFLGVILGSLIYNLTASKIFITIFEYIEEFFLKIFRFFFKLLLTPLIFLYNIVFKGIIFIFRPIYKVLYKLFLRINARRRFVARIASKTLRKS